MSKSACKGATARAECHLRRASSSATVSAYWERRIRRRHRQPPAEPHLLLPRKVGFLGRVGGEVVQRDDVGVCVAGPGGVVVARAAEPRDAAHTELVPPHPQRPAPRPAQLHTGAVR